MKMNNRWEMLPRFSASGKVLFRCRHCRRESTSPDKICVGKKCHEYEYSLAHLMSRPTGKTL